MKLKHMYALSVIGLILLGFGSGWITLTQILSLPINKLTAVGGASAMVGMAITIYTLSTIRKIDLIIEDEDVRK